MIRSIANNAATSQTRRHSPPRTIQVWLNRMPSILLPGQRPRTTDTLYLGKNFSPTPKKLTIGGRSYHVKHGKAEVPMFRQGGMYPATVTLANGRTVPVTFQISFAF